MPDQQLRTLLDQLHGELEHADQLDDDGRALLRQLAADIETRLNAPAADETPSLLDGLQNAIARFETSHPSLAALLEEALTALGNAGI